LKEEIPIIQGLQKASKDNLKQLGAALATAGMTNMFYYKTPRMQIDKIEKISVSAEDLKRTIEKLTTTSTQTPDLIFVGCPHCSLNEIRKTAEVIGNRKIKKQTEFWICTSRYIKEKARKYVEKIEKSGAYVLTDTCAVVTWTEKLGIKTITTNSAKTAHYAPTLNKAETILTPLEECIKKACKG
jgi:predicted aconitase